MKKVSFDYLPSNGYTLVLKILFFSSFIPHIIVYQFNIFNNVEDIGWVKKQLQDNRGHMSIKKLILLRLFVAFLATVPLLFIKDLFFIAVINGNIVCPLIGIICPVS